MAALAMALHPFRCTYCCGLWVCFSDAVQKSLTASGLLCALHAPLSTSVRYAVHPLPLSFHFIFAFHVQCILLGVVVWFVACLLSFISYIEMLCLHMPTHVKTVSDSFVLSKCYLNVSFALCCIHPPLLDWPILLATRAVCIRSLKKDPQRDWFHTSDFLKNAE